MCMNRKTLTGLGFFEVHRTTKVNLAQVVVVALVNSLEQVDESEYEKRNCAAKRYC